MPNAGSADTQVNPAESWSFLFQPEEGSVRAHSGWKETLVGITRSRALVPVVRRFGGVGGVIRSGEVAKF